MANNFQAFLVAAGHNGQIGVAVDDVGGVHQPAVDAAGKGRLGQAGADSLGNLVHGNGPGKLALTTVGKCNNRHCDDPSSGDPYERPHDFG